MHTKRRAQIASYRTLNRMRGFTLIEMLTVLVIGGILAAISLPYFFSRAVAAKQAEGKMLVSTLNRAQQAYYTEKSQFSDTVDALALKVQSSNYSFTVSPGSDTSAYVANHATSKSHRIRSYVGMAAVIQDQLGTQSIRTILCEAEMPGTAAASQPNYKNSEINCAPGTRSLQ